MADNREKGLQDYRKKLLEHKEIDGRLKECKYFAFLFFDQPRLFFDKLDSLSACFRWPIVSRFVMQYWDSLAANATMNK